MKFSFSICLRHIHYMHAWLFLCIILAACHKRSNVVEVSKRNFQEVIEQQQNLVFNFSHDLAADSLIGHWDTTAYIHFTPAVKGRFRWESTRELTFSPLQSFRPSTAYTAQLTQKFLVAKSTSQKATHTKTSAPASVSSTLIRFHTPYLSMAPATAYWARHPESGAPQQRLQLNFNYPVQPQEVARRLQVKVAGAVTNAIALSTAATAQPEFALASAAQTAGNEELPIEVTLRKGMPVPGSTYTSPQALTAQALLPATGNLSIIAIKATFEGGSPAIQVWLNQSLLKGQDLKNLVQIEPKVATEPEETDQGFLLKGEFLQGTTYQVTLSSELTGMFGSALGSQHQQFVTFGELEPALGFVAKKGFYLSGKGARNIGLRITNVPELQVTVYKIYRNNILAFMREGGHYNTYEDEYGDYGFEYQNLEEYGSVIYNRTYETNRLPKAQGVHLLSMNFNDLSRGQGFYVIEAQSTKDQWIKSRKTVSVSDIGLMVRETPDEILVFAHSLATAEPLAQTAITLISNNNQELLTATTNSAGLARFADLGTKAAGFSTAMVVAEKEDDFNHLLFRSSQIETSRFEVGGARSNAAGYQAFVYGDRDIYRPGETMYVNTILRRETPEAVVQLRETANLPIKLRLLYPSGKEYKVLRGKLNEQGAFSTAIPLPASAVTGTYTLEVLSATDVLLASKYLSVEEFIPDRIKVDLKTSAAAYLPGQQVQASAVAVNLFGPPAAFRNYEMQYTLQRKVFLPAGLSDFNFALRGNEQTYFNELIRQGKTDANGQLAENFDIPAHYADNGLLQGNIFTTVFDESGRPVNRVARFEVSTQPVYFGIRNTETYLSPGKLTHIGLAAVDKNGAPQQNAEAYLQVVHFRWNTVLEQHYSGQYRYVSQRKEEVILARQIRISGHQGGFTFVPPTSGEYEIRLFRPGASTFVTHQVYAYGYGQTESSAFEVDREGQVKISFDKAHYRPGENARILFKTPFSGRLLITAERNKVLEHFSLLTDKKSVQLVLPVKEGHVPNVYITATLIRPVTASGMPLTVAHGFASMAVEQPSTRLPLQIVAAAASGSQRQQTIMVKTRAEAGIQVTLAVVDEGILQLKNYQTPDPHAWFYQKRALEVNSYDVYAALLPELKTGQTSTGGDGYDLARRVNPLTNKRVKLVSNWSGILKTNAKGEVKYTITIPQFSGSLRIMAVAYKGVAFGSAAQAMQVADPLVLSTGLPRFTSPGDTILVPLTISNTTAQATQATAQLQTQGGFSIIGLATKPVQIAAHTEARVQYKVVAQPTMGTGKITALVRAGNRTYSESNDITIRPVTSLVKLSGSAEIQGGSNSTLTIFQNPEGMLPGTLQGQLIISNSPLARFAGNLDYLLQYPYGCVEQTISAAFPQLYFTDLAKAMLQNGRTAATPTGRYSNPAFNVQEAIKKIEGLQLYNGAMAMWPGSFEENWWATAYTAHFLYEAQQAGFEVNSQVLSRALLYLAQKARGQETQLLYYYGEQGKTYGETIVAKEVAYSLYVLALCGKPERAAMNRYKNQTKRMAIDSKYLLAGSFALIGDRPSFRNVLPNGFDYGKKALPATGGNFYSFIRDQGISLYTLVTTDPKNPQIPEMARRLSEQMLAEGSLSTQENIWAVLAFGKIARQAQKSTVTATITADGKPLANFTGTTLNIGKPVVGKKLQVQTNGKGQLYYAWHLSGTGTVNYTETDQNLQVRRQYYDRSGKLITGNQFAQNDLVVVKLTVRTANNAFVQNVVVTDMLPAGFEIENPRVGAVAELSWITDNAQPQHLDIRDDRIHYFTHVAGQVSFYYLARAVSKGNFVLGPASADAMYNPAYHSIHGKGRIVVTDTKPAKPTAL